MNITVVAGAEVFEDALRAARHTHSRQVDALASVLDAALLGKLEEVWDSVEDALRQGFRFGQAKAQAALDAAVAKAEELIEQAGSKARNVHEELLDRMQVYLQTHIQGALSRTPTMLPIGGQHYTLVTVRCAQKLVVTGSIKTSLTEVLALASTGELEISADYTLEPAKP